jgi:hypothetical protein
MPVAPKIMTFIRAYRYHDAESLDGGTGTVTTFAREHGGRRATELWRRPGPT